METKIVQINTVINTGSTGHIAEYIGKLVQDEGWNSYIAYGRNKKESSSIPMKIGNTLCVYYNIFITRIFDMHGLGSYFATKKFLRKLEILNPSLIHLHNIHGYYINYKLLFNWLYKKNIPVVWTLHDCWAYTGHCAYYSYVKCDKWKNECYNCKNRVSYPKNIGFSRSLKNFKSKKKLFTKLNNIVLVTPSQWLKHEVQESFLSKYSCEVIRNGISLECFHVDEKIIKEKIILGVANVWESRKGLNDFIKLSELLSKEYSIVLIGVSDEQKKKLPNNIIGIKRTENQKELVKWYNRAMVFFNPTYEDNFPTTNLEAMACGTPVITYNSDGAPETVIDNVTGYVVEKGDTVSVLEKIHTIEKNGVDSYLQKSRVIAENEFNDKKNYSKYIALYKELLGKK